MKIRPFDVDDTEAVVALWELCGLIRPWNDARKDIARKLSQQPELFLIGVSHNVVVASAMVGFDGHRGWLYYLAVAPEARRQSWGRSMVAQAESLLVELGCPKLNLLVRSTNPEVINFYRQLGYEKDDVTCLGRRLIPDS